MFDLGTHCSWDHLGGFMFCFARSVGRNRNRFAFVYTAMTLADGTTNSNIPNTADWNYRAHHSISSGVLIDDASESKSKIEWLRRFSFSEGFHQRQPSNSKERDRVGDKGCVLPSLGRAGASVEDTPSNQSSRTSAGSIGGYTSSALRSKTY